MFLLCIICLPTNERRISGQIWTNEGRFCLSIEQSKVRTGEAQDGAELVGAMTGELQSCQVLEVSFKYL